MICKFRSCWSMWKEIIWLWTWFPPAENLICNESFIMICIWEKHGPHSQTGSLLERSCGKGVTSVLLTTLKIKCSKWWLTLICTHSSRCHYNLFPNGISFLCLPRSVASFISSVAPVTKHARIFYNTRHVLTRTEGSQTPWNMECALESVIHKISDSESFLQPDRFSHIAFHIPSVTQYRQCRLNDKQRRLQEALGKWSLKILHFALTVP